MGKEYFETATVHIYQPVSYGDPSQASLSPGGLRLDKAIRRGDRLIIDFEKHACCPCNTTGLDQDCKYFIPHELAERGISANMWHEWCTELEKIQKKSPSIAGCLCLFCFPGGITQAILCAALCPMSAHHPCDCIPCCYGDWHYAIYEWQLKVNEVLNTKNMGVKLKTYKPHSRAPQSLNKANRVVGKDNNYECAMMEIALTAAETEKLRKESWDNGVNDRCCSGRGRQL